MTNNEKDLSDKSVSQNRGIKFRAIIGENTIIYFALKELFSNKFSIRELLKPWLLLGNKPDQYTGLKDCKLVDIYEGDILSYGDILAQVVWSEGGFYIHRLVQCGLDVSNSNLSIMSIDYMTFRKVIGNIYQNGDLLSDI